MIALAVAFLLVEEAPGSFPLVSTSAFACSSLEAVETVVAVLTVESALVLNWPIVVVIASAYLHAVEVQLGPGCFAVLGTVAVPSDHTEAAFHRCCSVD